MAQATYNGDEFSVTFDGNRTKPFRDEPEWPWGEIESVTIHSFTFLGLDFPLDMIPDNVYDALLEYADECEEWE